jgi:ATP-dependent RNA helicase DHR2
MNTNSRPKHQHGNLKTKAEALVTVRKGLPIWKHQEAIRQQLRVNDVLILVGETGSGKSTQIPQFLIEEPWCRKQKIFVTKGKSGNVGGCIAITQPRRVAAISLARRVASEMGSQLGTASPLSQVGYSVRFDHNVSSKTKIKFLTEGMLLQEILRDPWLKEYSAVVVDEAHERSVNIDLICGFLKNMLATKMKGRGGVGLKVVVMSATIDMNRMTDFFSRRQPSETKEKTDLDKNSKNGDTHTDESLKKDSNNQLKRASTTSQTNGDEQSDKVTSSFIEGRQYPVQTTYTSQPVNDYVDAALKKVFEVHFGEPLPGDILVFMPGQEDIEALERHVKEYALGIGPDVPRISVHPLFAALPQAAQQSVFLPAPKSNIRKVIIATNIAETSVTVPGVRFVIDSGKHKLKQFRSKLGLDSLLVKPISKSSAMQRAGRAGREAPGKCYRLYTEADFKTLELATPPEILRCDISQAVLTMKAHGITDVINFPFLDSPPHETLEKALWQLFSLSALSDAGEISELGSRMARLPLTPALSRVLLAAADKEADCLNEVIDIISCLSVENLFLNPASEERREEADESRKDLLRREGDHITLLTTIRSYLEEHTDRKAWCEKKMISHRGMQSVLDVRKQLRGYCKSSTLISTELDQSSQQVISSEKATAILKTFLSAFSSNTARITPDGQYRTITGNQVVAIHPSSVLFGKKLESIMYHQCVFTNRNYARGVSAVEMGWIADALAASG